MSRRIAPPSSSPLHPDRIRSVSPSASRVFLRQIRQAVDAQSWRELPKVNLILLERLQQDIECEIEAIASLLADKQQALQELKAVSQLLTGELPAHPGPGPSPRLRSQGHPTNADLVVEELRRLGGVQRAETVVNAIRRRHPQFGGATWRTQVYQILSHDERIEKAGRGLYKAKPQR